MSKTKLKTQNFFFRIYQAVKLIPKGKVATYGQIARVLGTKDARKVGWALHANKDPLVPCHRVVNKKGELAKTFAFGGSQEQKKRLKKEGINFSNKNTVVLIKHKVCL